MIRQLGKEDNEIVMSLLKKEPDLNLFLLGDIYNYGYDNDFQKVWGEFTQGELTAVLLKYHSNFIFYSASDFFAPGFASLMKIWKARTLGGKASAIDVFRKYFGVKPVSPKNLCKLDKEHFKKPRINDKIVKKANPENINELLDPIMALYDKIEEFKINPERDNIKKTVIDGLGRIFYIEESSEIIAMAQTTAENHSSAMIISVCTDPSRRSKGYATKCLSRLCGELLSEGKTLCLIYDNIEAGKIYERLGFEVIEQWSFMEIEPAFD